MSIHPLAVISPLAKIGPGVKIGPYCVIEPNVTIGPDCILESRVVIKEGTTLGRKTACSKEPCWADCLNTCTFPSARAKC